MTTPGPTASNKSASALKTVLLLFLVSRLILFAAAPIMNHYSVPLEPYSPIWHGIINREKPLIEPWRRWDALWFLNVARDGYSYRPDAQSNVTVFPLYPLAIRHLGELVGNDMLAGLLISNLSLLLLTFLLYGLVRDEAGDSAALGALLFLYSFPTAFLLTGVYSEALFMALCVASFRLARGGRWLPCAAIAALACSTRLAGIVILPALAVEYLSQKKWKIRDCRADVLSLLIVPAGLLAHFLFLHHLTGDFLVYFKAQSKWGHHLTSPFFSIAYDLGSIRNFWTYLNLASCASFLLLGYAALRGMRASYGIFALGIVILAMSATTLNGAPRYVLVAFPAFMALGKYVRPPVAVAAICLALLAIQGYCMFMFIDWRVSF